MVDTTLDAMSRRVTCPVLAVVAGLSVVSALTLSLRGLPVALKTRPALYWAVVAGVAVFGAVFPAFVAVWSRGRTGGAVVLMTAILSMFANGVSLSAEIRVQPASSTILLAVVLSIGLATLTFVARGTQVNGGASDARDRPLG